jgi:hypothetical protein
LLGDHQSDNVAEIDVGQLLEIAFGQLLLGAEEAPIDRFPVKALEGF